MDTGKCRKKEMPGKVLPPVDHAVIGSGRKTLVILPGIALKSTVGSADAIGQLFGMFEDYTILLVDDRSRVQEGYTIRDRAEDTAELLNALGIRDACVFGASMGGMTAQQLAARHPELVKKAVIASSSAQPKIDADAWAKAVNQADLALTEASDEGESPFALETWIEQADQAHLPGLIRQMNRLIYSPAVMEQFGEMLDAGPGPVSDEELKQFSVLAKAVVTYDGLQDLQKIQCPVLVIGSEGDRLLGPDASLKIARHIPGSSLYLYGPEYGHAVYDEAPDFRQKMHGFFEA